MIIYNNKESYQVFDKDLIPMGSLVFDPAKASLSMLFDERGLTSINTAVLKTEYALSHLPEGAVVAHLDKEIRVMCAADTKWVKQAVGPTGNANMYYMAMKIYAPSDDVVSFKEGDRGVIVDKMHTFDDDFAGIEADGRKYSIVWLALASYNAEKDIWTYFGTNSTEEKYIGWDYIVEWYDSEGKMLATDSMRINLSNEKCH